MLEISSKKVLVIANIYHSAPRIPSMLTYLNEFGYEPTLLTVPFGDDWKTRLALPSKFKENIHIVEIPFKGDIFWIARWLLALVGVKKTMSESLIEIAKSYARSQPPKLAIEWIAHFAHEVLAYPDTERTWFKPCYTMADHILETGSNPRCQTGDYELIFSSSPHPTVHMIASKLAKKYKKPWVADFRDPWTQNHVYTYTPIRKYFERKLELKTMQNCSFMTGATETMVRKQFNLHDKPSKVIYNGFDSEIKADYPLQNKFTISYTGTIYQKQQFPDKFLGVVRHLIDFENIHDIEIRFYGQYKVFLQEIIDRFNLKDYVKQCGMLPRSEIIKKQAESHVLLVFNWEDESEKSVCPLKYFEYMGIGRPVLATGGSHGDEIEHIMNQTNSGTYAVTFQDIKEALLKYYDAYLENKNENHQIQSEVDKYSFRSMAKQFAGVFDNVLSQTELHEYIESMSLENKMKEE